MRNRNDRNFSFKHSGLRLAVRVVFLSSVVFSLHFDYVQSDDNPRGTALRFCSDGRKKGHRLNSTAVHGHRFALSPVDCMVHCVQEKCCRSTNYRISHENTKENCELLHAVLSEEPENLQEDNDYNYNILLTPMKPFNCECSSCENNGRCEVSNKSCLCRPGFYGNRCQKGSALSSCDDPQALGMQSGAIPDAAITASSYWSPKLLPKHARLNTRILWCAWLKSDADSANPWLQVDFGKEVVVTAVATQGSCGDQEWTETYVIWYSNDGANWTYYMESGTTKIFTGNTDKSTVVTNYFQSPIIARYVRISPRSWHSFASTRIEYYGCP